MKRTIKILIILTAIIMLFLPVTVSYADSLDTIQADVSKLTVRPGEEVTLTINFGTVLGAYTFDIAYDNNIFEYVSTSEGTPNDDSTKVRVVYHDISGGSGGSESLTVVFKAKEGIETSNPTEFSITAEGMASPDTFTTYDDIVTPIVKNITVEPEYQDYNINLEYTGDIIAGEEKDMTITYSSSMGRFYEHARLVAEALTPSGANVKLVGIDDNQGEEDIIQSGWGDPQGYKIGGKDVSQVLNVTGLFTDAGDYTITLKLIDRDNSDSVIAEKAFLISAIEKSSDNTTEDAENPSNEEVSDTNNETINEEVNVENENIDMENNENISEEKPTSLPKTGNNIYIPISLIIIGLISFVVYYNRKNHK